MPRFGWRWAIITLRILAIIAWFAAIILPHLLLTAAGRRDVIPPPFLAGIGWLAGLRMRVEGRPTPGRLLLVANHVSWLDILALAGASRAAFVARGNLADNTALRWLCVQNDTVFINRDRRATIAAQVGQVETSLAERRVVVFPEGTTGDGCALQPFKSALLAAAERLRAGEAVAVQPVALVYADAANIAWVGEEPGLHNVLRILARLRPVYLTVRFCAPLRGVQLVNRKAMAGAAQAAVARMMSP